MKLEYDDDGGFYVDADRTDADGLHPEVLLPNDVNNEIERLRSDVDRLEDCAESDRMSLMICYEERRLMQRVVKELEAILDKHVEHHKESWSTELMLVGWEDTDETNI